jgi:hypothetical protein
LRRKEMHIKFRLGSTKRERGLERPGPGWEDIIKMDLRKTRWEGIGFMWFMIGNGGGLL